MPIETACWHPLGMVTITMKTRGLKEDFPTATPFSMCGLNPSLGAFKGVLAAGNYQNLGHYWHITGCNGIEWVYTLLYNFKQ